MEKLSHRKSDKITTAERNEENEEKKTCLFIQNSKYKRTETWQWRVNEMHDHRDVIIKYAEKMNRKVNPKK